jgi:hypothetical protein
VSQTYLSLIERGTRPLTAELRGRLTSPEPDDDTFRAQMSRLGYSAFAHIKPPRAKSRPDLLLWSVLSRSDADSRIVEALPWLIRTYAAQMNFTWLVRQAKLHNLQNRLGYLLQLSGATSPEVPLAIRELEDARLLKETTLCWDSMRESTRDWMRCNRSPLAAHWNILTALRGLSERDG